ncbi:hypothetical protein Aph01nite_13110 [Acrocarpospora phusangensis]|uniref:Uncharacterized protein n=1 Tax=Acrocarpospora phusangensis TaxID=1070424 RepID=A0A919Q7J2_9ACTN|nr:hypothetical protein [Acrocarpospora phusangensis]GIH23001.1 hypothetical protein Aph01nite_13110 [Acrocarpospora phusangensis]
MAGKTSGIGWTTFTLADSGGTPRDVRNDLTGLQFGTPRGVWDVTGIDKSGMERRLLLADFSTTMNGAFNPDANKSHDVLKTVPSTSVARAMALGHGGVTLSVNILITDYSFNRAQSGELPWTAPGVLADGAVPTWAAV